MRREELEQIRGVKARIKSLQEELQDLPIVTDSVKGSMTEHPYIERNIVIRGVDEKKGGYLRRKLDYKLEELQDRLLEMEDWLESIPDDELRAILCMKYRNGMKEEDIAKELGYTRSAISMKLQRIFKK